MSQVRNPRHLTRHFRALPLARRSHRVGLAGSPAPLRGPQSHRRRGGARTTASRTIPPRRRCVDRCPAARPRTCSRHPSGAPDRSPCSAADEPAFVRCCSRGSATWCLDSMDESSSARPKKMLASTLGQPAKESPACWSSLTDSCQNWRTCRSNLSGRGCGLAVPMVCPTWGGCRAGSGCTSRPGTSAWGYCRLSPATRLVMAEHLLGKPTLMPLEAFSGSIRRILILSRGMQS